MKDRLGRGDDLMRVILPVLAVVWMVLAGTAAPAQSVTAVALANSLQQDFACVQALLDNRQPPWASVQSRPQPEPINALRLELPGNCIWARFKPVEAAVREAHRQQRKVFLGKDAGLIERREARAGIQPLAAAILQEREAFEPSLIRCARQQVAQIDNAPAHDEYHAAECILWSMADRLGLWDRQAALETAAEHLGTLRARALCDKDLSADEVKGYKNQIGCLTVMVQRAITWQPTPCCPPATPVESVNMHFASDPLSGGLAFGPWRDSLGRSGATQVVLNRPFFRAGMQAPAANTYDLSACPELYRDWQYTLHDFRYGWLVYNHSAANGLWRPHGDWRELAPNAFWPGAKGSQTAGGL